jgi:3-hydroxyisobutyrate dehydrogenase-like beta-hydroxyacid dehydrogenase
MPVLLELGSKVVHVGPSGTGEAVKLVNNLLLGCNMAALAEALVLGTRLGIRPEVIAEVVGQSSGNSYALKAKAEGFILKGNFAPGFAIDLQYKDLDLAAKSARGATVPLPMGNLALQVFEAARARGLGREDISAVVRLYEELCGTEVRRGG